ncbi:WD40 repeat domain-containing protein [Streptomyces sp. NPDC049837]|uniref:WD40 repeat domain-containing protein n=1 Tax=Streptomyces sp. NPDC049837 TaxID=3155277 RepID=UPI0034488107
MHRRSTSTATALAVLFSSAALVASTAGTAAADSAKTLPLSSVGDMVVDGAHQRVFLSDPQQGKIIATDYSGTVLATVSALPGVEGLALNAASDRLYAAVPGSDAIVALDPATVTVTGRFPTGTGTDPRSLAVTGDKVWFGYGPSGEGDIGSLDVAGAEPVVTLDQAQASGWYSAPLLTVAPGAPGTLAAADREGSGGALRVYDVTSGRADQTAAAGASGRIADAAFTPDGSRIITATPGGTHTVWQTSDLSQAGAYETNTHYANGVAVAADGTVAAGTMSWYDPDLHVFLPGGTSPVRRYDFPNTGTHSGADTLAEGALAWDPTGSRLFAVSGNSEGVHTLRTFTDSTKSVPTVTVTAPATAARAKPLTVTGKVSATVALPAGTPLTVTRFDVETPAGKALAPAKTDASGAFSFTDTPPAGGTVTYKVSYAGSATHAAATASTKVQVSRAAVSLTLTGNGTVHGQGADVKFTARLGTTYKNRVVEIWTDPYGADAPKRLLKRGTVDANGNLSVVVDMTRDTTVTAVFAGDARYAPKTVKSTAYAKVRIATTLSGHYKTGTISGIGHHYYRKSVSPVVTTTMSYYAGRKQRLELQVYYDGQWYGSTEYFALSTSGVSRVSLGAPGESGIRARVRSSYIDPSSGDSANYTTHGGWKYLYFTN